MTILFFLIALGVLIFIHEFGHFLLAKRADIYVETFSLGFGPKLAGITRGETEYRLSLLPLGGYVKMRGEEPGEEGGDDPRSFANKGVWARTKVILFGPLMNLVLALVLMPVVFLIGRSEPVYLSAPPEISGVRAESPAEAAGLKAGDLIRTIDGKPTATWEEVLNKVIVAPGSHLTLGIERSGVELDEDVVVGELPEIKGGYLGVEPMLFLGNEARVDGVRPGGPAAEAGLKEGDVVLAFGGEPVGDWLDLTRIVNATEGKPAQMEVQRGEERLTVPITAARDEETGRWVIGITKDRQRGVPMTVVRYGLLGAIVKGTEENLKLTSLTFDVLGRLVTLKLSYKVLGGPILIAKSSAAAAASGFTSFLYFLAFLSLQLAILNLLPIPVLDGGQLVFLACEAVRRRPLSIRVRNVAQQVGFALLISLMLVVTFNDIDQIWGLRSLLHKLF
jgi:regulator of sigma E protease